MSSTTSTSNARSPFVYWSQTEGAINLKVVVSNSNHPTNIKKSPGKSGQGDGDYVWRFSEPQVTFDSSNIDFKIDLIYPNDNEDDDMTISYSFNLEFPHSINPRKSNYRVIKYDDNSPSKSSSAHTRVEISLEKVEAGWWNKITKNFQHKPHWLKIDFDKWKIAPESDDGDGDDEDGLRKRKGIIKDDILSDYPDLLGQLQREELGEGSKNDSNLTFSERLRLTYLFLYNIFQFIGYLYIVGVLSVKFLREGTSVTTKAYSLVGGPVKYMQILQILEVLHPILKFTSGSFVFPMLQIFGRCIILFAIISTEQRIQPHPCVFYLFLTWSLAEIFRYPHYILQIDFKNPRGTKKVKKEPQYVARLISWVRYSAWIPLYPLGFACEAISIFLSINYFDETRKFSISMPNFLNATFSFTAVMRLYLLFGLFPLLYTMMMHMLRARRKQKFKF